MFDEFDISKIDFSKHKGIKRLGIKDLTIQKQKDYITIKVQSENVEFNQSSIKVIPKESGFNASMTLGNGVKYVLNWSKKGESEFQHITKSKTKTLTESDHDSITDYDESLKLVFQLPNYVLFAIRELYFKFLIDNMPDSLLHENQQKVIGQQNNAKTKATDGTYCNYYPTVYLEAWCSSFYVCSLTLLGNLNVRCSNQWCIGCCNYYIERQCLWGQNLCVLFGYGHTCFAHPGGAGSDPGVCEPNYPCPSL